MNKQKKLIDIDHDQGVDILKWLQLILSNWLFILICIIISLVVAFYVNKLSTPLFTVQSTILINDYHNPLDKIYIPSISGYQQAFQIENEIGILKSSNLVNSTINKLNYWVDYKCKTNNFTYSSISHCPFTIEFDLFHPQLISSVFKLSYINDSMYKVEVETDESFTYDYFYHKKLNKITNYSNEHIVSANNSIETSYYKFTIVFNDSLGVQKLMKNRYAFDFQSLRRLKGMYSQFEVENLRGSSILKLTLKSPNPKKAAVFLNKLTDEYLNKGIEREDKIASKTIEFIDNQLVSIVDSLTVSENQLEDFRKQNQLLNLDFQAQQAFQKMEELQNEKSRFIVKLRYIDYLTESLSSDEHTDNLIVPASLEINDPVLNNLVNELIKLFKEHSELSLNSLKNNPYLSSLEQQINYTKEKLSETIKNISEATQLALDNNQKRIDLIEKRINKLPQDQRMLFNIERRFQLNDELYTFLLTKRSEMQIIKASNLPKNEILDFAAGSEYKIVFPNKKLNYLIGLFLGFSLPLLLLWIYHNFNRKIRSIDDIKQLTNYPVIATIFNDTNPGLFVKEQNSAIKESLRTLKANLQFIIKEEQSNIIMITSTIPGEGKSYISTHLASIYTSFGKSVCLADFDLRKGKISRNFNMFSEEGLSTLLSGRSKLEDIICKSEYGFDILPSGAIPPNPGVLISSSNCEKLFNTLKEKYDIVIIDTPPVGVVSDTLFLNTKVEQILYVSRFNESPTPLLNHVLGELEMKKINNLAIILNAVPNKKHTYGYSYGYGYGYGYYSNDKNRFFQFLGRQKQKNGS